MSRGRDHRSVIDRYTRAPIDAGIEVAVEHASWCLRQGLSPLDVFVALGQPAPLLPGWNDVIFALAKADEDLRSAEISRAAQRRKLAA